MVEQKRKSRQSRQRKSRQRKSRQSRRRQSGGSLAQGQVFANIHKAQHGGSRELVGAPLGYSGVLDAGMRGAAGVEKYDQYFAQAQAHAQAGGSRSRSRRKSKSRRMRGGFMSPADVGQSYTLSPSYAGVSPPQASHASPSPASSSPASMKGGRRQRKSRSKSRSKSRQRKSRQRGGFSPVGSPTMLLSNSEYDKAGLHPDFKNPL